MYQIGEDKLFYYNTIMYNMYQIGFFFTFLSLAALLCLYALQSAFDELHGKYIAEFMEKVCMWFLLPRDLAPMVHPMTRI